MFEKLSQHEIFTDNTLKFRVDQVRTPEGQVIEHKVVVYHDSAAVVAVSGDDQILLLRHYRYPVEAFIWEIPGGIMERNEDPKSCALRELEEETGYHAQTIESIMPFYPEPAFTTQTLYLFLAQDLSKSSSKDETEIREVRFFTANSVLEMIRKGSIKSSWSIIGLLWTLSHYFGLPVT